MIFYCPRVEQWKNQISQWKNHNGGLAPLKNLQYHLCACYSGSALPKVVQPGA
jgi:hypothetical protein